MSIHKSKPETPTVEQVKNYLYDHYYIECIDSDEEREVKLISEITVFRFSNNEFKKSYTYQEYADQVYEELKTIKNYAKMISRYYFQNSQRCKKYGMIYQMDPYEGYDPSMVYNEYDRLKEDPECCVKMIDLLKSLIKKRSNKLDELMENKTKVIFSYESR